MPNDRPRHPRSRGGTSQGAQLSARRVLDLLNASIRDGFIAEDAPLVEEDLMRVFNASRGAVRDALSQLSAIGMVERRPKLGTRLNQSRWTLPLTDFQSGDHHVMVEVVEDRAVGTSPLLRERLRTDASQIRMVENLWTVGGTILGVRTAYFEISRSGDLSRLSSEPVTMVEVMEDFFGEHVGSCSVWLGSESAETRTAALLGIPVGAPLTLREVTYLSRDGLPTEVVFDRFRGDIVRLHVDISSAAETLAAETGLRGADDAA